MSLCTPLECVPLLQYCLFKMLTEFRKFYRLSFLFNEEQKSLVQFRARMCHFNEVQKVEDIGVLIWLSDSSGRLLF